jgi:acetylglutamate kinase
VTRSATLVKFGGELLEEAERLEALAVALARVAGPLTVVHGGGREIDAALKRTGIEKRQVDGIRITDRATLDVVIGVLAGVVNTRFVAALSAAGARAVGLTGVDAGLAPCLPAPRHRTVDGRDVDLGLVGQPTGGGTPALLNDLMARGYLPVIASLAADGGGAIYNVNADTLAGSLAARLGVHRLVIAGATAGVLDEHGCTIPRLDVGAIDQLVRSGVASAGMVAKLKACRDALAGGVEEVVLVDGRQADVLEAAVGASVAGLPATRMVA